MLVFFMHFHNSKAIICFFSKNFWGLRNSTYMTISNTYVATRNCIFIRIYEATLEQSLYSPVSHNSSLTILSTQRFTPETNFLKENKCMKDINIFKVGCGCLKEGKAIYRNVREWGVTQTQDQFLPPLVHRNTDK